jgi:glucan 1,3-beta-glucosidase
MPCHTTYHYTYFVLFSTSSFRYFFLSFFGVCDVNPSVVQFNQSLAESHMETHLSSWVRESDFAQIAAAGFNSVRVPLGYWNVLANPDSLPAFVPSDPRRSLQYLDWAFDLAAQHGLSVLLDLHGAPGSQNGVDHSGCSAGGANWLEVDRNVGLTLRTLEVLAERYAVHPALLGFELVNEPAAKYSQEPPLLSKLLDFYAQAYGAIRTRAPAALVVFNELYEEAYPLWANQLQEPQYYNVVMDVHLYNWQEPYTEQEAPVHIANAQAWAGLLDELNQQHPIIVGEWSFSTGTYVQAGQPFVDACVASFKETVGWYIWNWKIERGIHFDEWNVQYQHQLKHGLTVV